MTGWGGAALVAWLIGAPLAGVALGRMIAQRDRQIANPERAVGVSRDYAAAHPDGPEDFDG